MKSYLIAYDVEKTNPDLVDAISACAEDSKSQKMTWNSVSNVWIIRSHRTVVEIRDYLLHFFNENEHLLVLALTGYAAWNTHDDEDSQRLKDIL